MWYRDNRGRSHWKDKRKPGCIVNPYGFLPFENPANEAVIGTSFNNSDLFTTDYIIHITTASGIVLTGFNNNTVSTSAIEEDYSQ